MINDIINKHVRQIQIAQDGFVREMVKKHCNVFQRLWFAVCLKMKWRVGFVKLIHQQSSPESYPGHDLQTFKITMRIGVEINGKVYWVSNHSQESA